MSRANGKSLIDKLEDYFDNMYLGEDVLFFDESIAKKADVFPDETTEQIKKRKPAEFSTPERKEDLFAENPDWTGAKAMDELYDKICNCAKCPLAKTRNKFVFGSGNPNADIMIIGEAPGADEDKQGLPFVGRAGQLLTKILEAIDLSREEVFIGNIIKCRPPNNRRPTVEEVEQCEPYLQKQIELIKPAFIIALGLTAIDSLLKKKHRMSDMRGKVLDYRGVKLIPTYHPAALLRNPNLKRQVWEDMKSFRALYDEFVNNK